MPNTDLKKIVYLFGAGSTQAELSSLLKEKLADQKFFEKNSLLTKDISKRVTSIAQTKSFFKSIQVFSTPKGSSNIELLISLIEDNAHQIKHSARIAYELKRLVKKDIERVLNRRDLKGKFYLHKALLELDKAKEANGEKILGYISLNYDSVLDEAYCEIRHTKKPNYCLPPFGDTTKQDIPLLKLHGSFNWKTKNKIVKILPTIPLGVNKNYLQVPYNFIWGYAHQILEECDILRVIGCSLSQNDLRLIDLLFKAHLHKRAAFEIHVISFDESGDEVKRNYQFFNKIKNFSEIFGVQGSNSKLGGGSNDSFQKWLKLKAAELDEHTIKETTYLKKLIT